MYAPNFIADSNDTANVKEFPWNKLASGLGIQKCWIGIHNMVVEVISSSSERWGKIYCIVGRHLQIVDSSIRPFNYRSKLEISSHGLGVYSQVWARIGLFDHSISCLVYNLTYSYDNIPPNKEENNRVKTSKLWEFACYLQMPNYS